MAINIFSGSAGRGKSRNRASASTRAANAKQALAKPGETSSSGSTAVGTSGTLAKVGNFVGQAAGIASKFLPGVGGIVAKGLSNLLNDPEWWQTVPGDAVTLNVPLRMTEDGKDWNTRVAMVEILSRRADDAANLVMNTTDTMITQYLAPEIRKVVNAIPLQDASAYRTVLEINASIYAVWRTLLKWDYLLKHGNTYVASMNDPMFPFFQVENSAALQSAINRLEEYLRANVRLPHTLCEYLAWRFGRVYRSNNSVKSAFILYNAIPIETTPAAFWTQLEAWMSTISSNAAYQAANADLFNAYYDHEMKVEIREDTQVAFDYKEFALRTNCDISTWYDEPQNGVFIDSALDNPTAFMASTVSTNAGEDGTLFPVSSIRFYMPGEAAFSINSCEEEYCTQTDDRWYMPQFGIDVPQLESIGDPDTVDLVRANYEDQIDASDVLLPYALVEDEGEYTLNAWALKFRFLGWHTLAEYHRGQGHCTRASAWWVYRMSTAVDPDVFATRITMVWGDSKINLPTATVEPFNAQLLATYSVAFESVLCKAVDLYNKDRIVPFASFTGRPGQASRDVHPVDTSALSADMGIVSDKVLATEQLYAFANLVAISRKTSMSYGKAEKLVARDTAELVEKLDIATPAT